MTEGPLRAGTTGPWRQRGVSFWLSQALVLTGGWWMSHSSLTLSLPFGKSKSSPLWWHRALCDLAPSVLCPHLPRPPSLSNPWVALLFLRSVRPREQHLPVFEVSAPRSLPGPRLEQECLLYTLTTA